MVTVRCTAKLLARLRTAPAREFSTLARRIPVAIAELLGAIGIADVVIESERREMCAIACAMTASRSGVGSLVEFSHLMDADRGGEPIVDLLGMSLRLCGTPVLPLKHTWPIKASKELLGAGISGLA